MQIQLQEEIVDKLSFKGTLAYVAVVRRGAGEWTTGHLALFVGCRTEIMREGLEELSMAHPEITSKATKGKWTIGVGVIGTVLIVDQDRRRLQFLDDVKVIWEWANKGQKFTMSPADGNAVRQFLKQHSDWDGNMWRVALKNRFRSEVNRGQALYAWLRKLPEYLGGPLDRFGKPMQHGVGGKLGEALSREESNRLAREAATSQNRA